MLDGTGANAPALAGAPARADAAPPTVGRLSPRELDVLRLVSTGCTNREIGMRLDLSVHAVKFRLASAYRKLGVANRTEATSMLLAARGNQAGRDVDSGRVDKRKPD